MLAAMLQGNMAGAVKTGVFSVKPGSLSGLRLSVKFAKECARKI
jgi:hypothetical protein